MSAAGSQRKRSPVTMYARLQTVIVVAGTLDRTTAQDLERMVTDNLDDQISELILDLSGVTIIDSPGLAQLSAVRSICQERSVALKIIPGEVVREFLTSHDATGAFTLIQAT